MDGNGVSQRRGQCLRCPKRSPMRLTRVLRCGRPYGHVGRSGVPPATPLLSEESVSLPSSETAKTVPRVKRYPSGSLPLSDARSCRRRFCRASPLDEEQLCPAPARAPACARSETVTRWAPRRKRCCVGTRNAARPLRLSAELELASTLGTALAVGPHDPPPPPARPSCTPAAKPAHTRRSTRYGDWSRARRCRSPACVRRTASAQSASRRRRSACPVSMWGSSRCRSAARPGRSSPSSRRLPPAAVAPSVARRHPQPATISKPATKSTTRASRMSA